jgi:UDP-2,3-diacylglucosamine pyrophosphatase LpxH
MIMKQLFAALLVLLHLSCGMSRPLKLGIISDVHYLSEKLMDGGQATASLSEAAGRDMTEIPAVLNEALAEYLRSDIDILLIAGDITNNGEKQSHMDFTAKLRPLLDKGVRIFVVPGNHDINIPRPAGYRGSETFQVETVSPAEFEKIYEHCGYSSAIRRDTASLSYVAALNDNIWMLALDGCRYREYTVSSISGGKLPTATENWVLNILNEAKKLDITVVAMMHHGLAEHFAGQEQLFPQYLIDAHQRLASLFADNGIKVVFTGHFHANDISQFTTETNKVYDIETGSLAAYPYPFRFAELSGNGIDVSTKHVRGIASNPNLHEEGKARLKRWAQRLAIRKISEKLPNLPSDIMPQAAAVISDIIVLHIEGDEIINEELQQQIAELAAKLDMPLSLAPENLQIDTPPEDNHVHLEF